MEIGTSQDLGISHEKVCLFYEQNWGRKIALSNESFYKWQFIDTPKNYGIDDCCLVIENNNIVAAMGLNSRNFILDGKTKNAAELTTWIVREDKRNLGLGPKMLSYLQSKFDVLIGMGISEQALPIYLRMNFKYLKSIPRYLKVLNINTLEKYGTCTNLFKKVNKLKVEHTFYEVHDVNKENINKAFNKFSLNSNLFDRSFKNHTWRYQQHPSFNYQTKIISNENGNQCVISFRIDRLVNFTIIHCMDLFGDQLAFNSAISFLEDEAKNVNADIVDFYCTNTAITCHFIEKNWFSILNNDFINFPHLFHPVEVRTPSTTSLILWTKEHNTSLCDFGKLYITKQDCDFDRPTASNL